MAKRGYKSLSLQDFTGGLNYRSDQFSMKENESPDLLNIDVDPKGGVRQRNGVDAWHANQLGANATGLWGFHTSSGTNHLMVSHGDNVSYSSGGSYTSLLGGGGQPAVNTVTTRSRGVTFNNVSYAQNGTDQPLKWDGSSASRLTQSFNDSLVVTGGNMPIATHIAVWNNHLWVADTTESSERHYNRLRWSHINEGEDWHTDHYVDIAVGEDGDRITALVPFGDRLLVFKHRSIHALVGYDTDSFQLHQVSNSVGCELDSSPVATPTSVYFWFANEGVYRYKSDGLSYVFENIAPAIDDGRIDLTEAPHLAYADRRVYCSVKWSDPAERRLFVYDESLNKKGSWVLHTIPAGVMYSYNPSSSSLDLVATYGQRVLKLEQDTQNFDQLDGATDTHISSHYTTSWVSAKTPMVKKRWGRARTVVLADSTIDLPVKVYRDYDFADIYRSFTVSITGRSSTSVWDDAEWQNTEGTSGDGVWASVAESTATDFGKHPNLGTAMAVSVKVEGPTTNNTWELNALGFSFRPRSTR